MEEQELHIDQYLSGELSGEKLRAFEDRLTSDPNFAKKVELARQINLEMQLHFENKESRQELANLLTDFGNRQELGSQEDGESSQKILLEIEKPKQEKTNQKGMRRFLHFAAVAACAAALLLFFRPWSSSLSPAELYIEQYSPPDWQSGTRSGEDQEQKLLDNANNAFQSKQFQKAEKHLSKYLQEQPEDAEARYYRAIAQMEQGRHQSAISDLQQLGNGSSVYRNDANWYLSLCYLKLNKKSEAKEVLTKLLSSEKYRNKEIKKTLQHLD